MSVKLNSSGGGSVTLQEPTTASDFTLTLPAQTANVITDSSGVLNIGSGQIYKDASGNVGIGTSSPNSKLNTYAAANALSIQYVATNQNAVSPTAAIGFNVSDSSETTAACAKGGIGFTRNAAFGGGYLAFYNNNSGAAGNFTTADEKARIDSSGNLLVGTTSGDPIGGKVTGTVINPGTVQVMANNIEGFKVGRYNGTGILQQLFYHNGTTLSVVGNITTNGSTAAYNTSSDYRLKYDVQPLVSGLKIVSSLKPVSYKWKVDDSDGEGFIAHELQEIVPLAVNGEKDATDAEGNPVYQGVDYSKIVVHLVSAIQELKAELDAAKAEIEILKGPK